MISKKERLNSYIQQFSLNTLFQSDMSRYMELFLFRKGETICESSFELKYLYFLVSGKLKVYTILSEGKSLLLRFNKPLSVIGDVEFLNQLLVRCNVEAQSDSELIGIKFQDLYQHAYNDPVFLRFLISNLSHKLSTISNSASVNLLYPLENRLASYLWSVNVNGDEVEVEGIKTQKLTEIAMLLGTSYRHLNRILKQFRQEGIISETKGTLSVTDLVKLKTLAKENIYE